MILKNNWNSTRTPSSNPIVPPTQLKNLVGGMFVGSKSARVNDIVLDENHPRFDEVGRWNGIGTIFFELNANGTSTDLGFAKPLFPFLKNYPLKNELVLLFSLPNTGIGENFNSTSHYYINAISIWNHPHHNAYPNLNKDTPIPPSQQLDYQQVEGGVIRRVADGSSEIKLNSIINNSQNTFSEKSNIHPLLSFSGDCIYEGRWGNSIRLGSTAKSNSELKNPWSEGSSQNGDPILIIRNGQPIDVSEEGWIPIVEDINKDLSNLYLTSTQRIPFNKTTSDLFKQTNRPPIDVSRFNKSQIISVSDRILMYAKSDSILIGAKRSLHLSTNGLININSQNLYADSSNIRLGDKNANESLILGDSFLNELNSLIKSLNTLCLALSTLQNWPGGSPVPNAPVNAAANNLLNITQTFSNKINTFKSKVSKTK